MTIIIEFPRDAYERSDDVKGELKDKNVELKHSWQDGTGKDITKTPRYAREHGSLKTYPGCGSSGVCKPCGKIMLTPNGWQCAQWFMYGCPSTETQARHVNHDWMKTKCSQCGTRKGWLSLKSKKWYQTQHKAAMAGEDTRRLVRWRPERKGERK